MESVALISWQFGTGPYSPGKATDVSEPVRHARREGGTRTHPTQSHACTHTAHVQTTNTQTLPNEMLVNREKRQCVLRVSVSVRGLQKHLCEMRE